MSQQSIPSMGGDTIAPFLYETARSLNGGGDIVECGSWLGASIEPVLRGLRDAGSEAEVHCYDRWEANESEARKAKAAGVDVSPGDDLRPLFLSNVGGIYPKLVTHRTDLLKAEWDGGAIELYIDDANKRPPLFQKAMRTFGPAFVPGQTILVLMDYQFYREFDGRDRRELRCQRDFIESHPDSFEQIADLGGMTGVAFRYTGGVDFDAVELGREQNTDTSLALIRDGIRYAANGEFKPIRRFIRNEARSFYLNHLRPVSNRLYRLTDTVGVTGPKSVYRDQYYQMRTGGAQLRDAREVAEAIHGEFRPASVIDLGCAVGHYLLPFFERGAEIHGVDGHPAALEHAVIPDESLELADLREPYTPPQRFDVALCIEVAEHLAPRYARTLVESLTSAAPVVVFTAAQPGQGGTHHVNERPREYWKRHFAARGYEYDRRATDRIRAAVDVEKVSHVPENLFIFQGREP